MDAIENAIDFVNSLVWGSDTIAYPPVLMLLLGVGLYLTVRLGFMPILRIPYAFGQLFRKRSGTSEGDVSPFGALMTALSSTIGTGNIAGVAVAIAIGGPGAVFWMWMTALVGMASKYAEGVLAVRFRELAVDGERHIGGPMYYIKNGMGNKWIWLAFTFAGFGVLASWGTGAYIQANSIALAFEQNYSAPPLLIGGVLALGAAAVILGGIQRIAAVATKLVPFMAIAYLGAGLVVVGMNIEAVPAAFGMIFTQAFGYDAATGGIIGGILLLAMQKGVARGIFSNEAGQGSAPIAHAAAKNKDPVNQGIVAMLGTFIDTIIVCSITALVILTSGIIPEACSPFVRPELLELPKNAGCETSSALTVLAFSASLGDLGGHIVAISLAIFGFTTILGWSYYGERCAEFLFGNKVILPFKFAWIFFVFAGAAVLLARQPITIDGNLVTLVDGELFVDGVRYLINENPVAIDASTVSLVDGVLYADGSIFYLEGALNDLVNLLWLVADTLTGLMAAPNLIALLVLSPLVAAMTKEYFAKQKASGS